MNVIETISRMQAARRQMAGSVGLVPTMGALHQGHLSLVKMARAENDVVVVSIFVNPKQFGPSEDFASYPRDYQRDLAMLEKEGSDLVFMPTVEEMYPAGFDTYVNVGAITQRLEGASRPGHFKGVATVVAKLFNIVRPTRAYFGEKDAQQLRVIRKMVQDLAFDTEVVPGPTVREPDGLAMSSRNKYLHIQERQAAAILFRALSLAQQKFGGGERDAERLRRAIGEVISSEPLANIDYVSIADADTLDELTQIRGRALASLAVRIGKTRLIDNVLLGESPRRPVS
ncbi:MAG: pantoate--beta-alanine ligase [Chloroflexi bacterium]|nr:pantoate--beta-alanine ligase [Chloroflexota bacterium]